jgi:hypothetical protein
MTNFLKKRFIVCNKHHQTCQICIRSLISFNYRAISQKQQSSIWIRAFALIRQLPVFRCSSKCTFFKVDG